VVASASSETPVTKNNTPPRVKDSSGTHGLFGLIHTLVFSDGKKKCVRLGLQTARLAPGNPSGGMEEPVPNSCAPGCHERRTRH
jgi:hypothetical protein